MNDTAKLPSTAVVVAITAIATTVLYAVTGRTAQSPKETDEEEYENDSTSAQRDANGAKARGDRDMMQTSQHKKSDKVAPFPWEVASNNSSAKSPSENPAVLSCHHSSKAQLDFLASMTFANGGLRPPSCPCCI